MTRLLPAAGCRPILLATAVLASLATGSAQQQTGAPASSPKVQPATYMGSETCQACHEDIYKAFQQNPHHAVDTDKKRGFENNACESCHGPASKHEESLSAADIRQPAKLTPAAADHICLTCHQNQPTQVGRINSSHAKNQVSCVACHSIHKNGPHGLVPRTVAAINEQCKGCHTPAWASFQQPYRHRLPEGAMSCVDCHDPHGAFLPHMLRTTQGNEPVCFKCHGEKAGPFVFPHAALDLGGCGTCHEPHGSANPRMLVRPQVRFVCLECHANLPLPTPGPTLGTVPPAFHDLRSPRFQNCTICHQKIHGSYVNRDFLK